MNIHVAAIIARASRGLLERSVRFLEKETQSRHAIIAHYSAYRWCDSTERALNNELMGRGNWLTHS
jgi:hypothetical protein